MLFKIHGCSFLFKKLPSIVFPLQNIKDREKEGGTREREKSNHRYNVKSERRRYLHV